MADTLRPRVKLSETIQELVTPGASPLVIGIMGISQQGTENEFNLYTNIADLETDYGRNVSNGAQLVALAETAFAEGATAVKVCSIGTPTVTDTDALTAPAAAGAESVTVASNTGYAPGGVIYIGTGNAGFAFEERRVITSISGAGTINFAGDPLQFDHTVSESVHLVTEPVAADYTDAFVKLQKDRDINCVLTQNDDNTTATALLAAVNGAIAKDNVMFAVRSFARGVDEATAKSATSGHDDSGMVAVWPTVLDKNGKYLTGSFGAAAVAGAISGRGVPAVNYNLLELDSFGGIETDITDYDALIENGVSPIEFVDNTIRVSRLITTNLTIDGSPSDLLQEASVRINVNHIKRTVQRQLERRFLRSGNTPSTREQIRSTVRNILISFVQNEILTTDEATGTPGFKDPQVTPDPENRKQVRIEVEIAPTLPLVWMDLNFRLNL